MLYYWYMKRIISLCLVLLIGAGLFSCVSSAAPNTGQTGSSVWRISKDGGTLYLGGSVHILRDTDYPLPNQFDMAFSQSAVLVLETDIEQLADEYVVEYLMYQVFLPDGQTLRSVLDSDTYKLLEAAFNEYGYGFLLDGMTNYKPSMVINVLTMLQVQKFGFVQEGVDMYYLEKAKNEKKSVDYLESIESQIDLLVTMGDGYENEYVLYSLQDMASTESDLAILLDEWKNGRSSTLETSLIEMKEEWPDMYKAMITDRNSAWMPQIEKFLASGKVYFVIVGLAHLHGPDGLLRQLEDSGCVVENL